MHYPPLRQTEKVNTRVLTVEGKQKLSILPSIAEIRLGVEERHLELSIAQQENAQKIHQIIQSIVSLGISQANIQTVDYTIFPIYDYIEGNQQFKGHQVTHHLSILIEDLKQTGVVIDTAIQNGANRISNIQFTVKNMDVHYQQALKGALENAQAKALTITNTLGITLFTIPIQITELSTRPSPIPQQMFTETGVVAGISTQIEPGRLDIEAKLEVKYGY